MRKSFLILVSLLLIGFTLFSQQYVLNVYQPPVLVANAGDNASISFGQSVVLGGEPTAQFGNGDYLYFWEPSLYLDDANSPNPVATPSDTITYFLTVIDAKGCEAESQVTVNVITSDINSENFGERVKIFPNPNNGIFSIYISENLQNSELTILDVLGNQIYHSQKAGGGNNSGVIDLSDKAAGLYIIRLKSDQTIITKTFVIN